MSWPIGKTWDLGTTVFEPEHAAAYADATGDTSAAYADGIAPPMVHVRLMQPLLWGIATDAELGLDVLRLVHGEHTMQFGRPLRVGEAVHIHGELLEVVEKATGLLVVSGLYGDIDGERVLDGRTAFFIRAKNPPKREKKPRKDPPTVPAPDWQSDIEVPDDASHVYAVASLDDNPIHISKDVATKAGLPDVILQGLCTMALTVREAVIHGADGDVTRLKQAGFRFARPVFNGQRLSARGWKTDDGYMVETLGPDGKPVLANGDVRFS
ncbi:MAG: hypothetical protein GY913_11910 [Proteobacteria bacterium]|nr:hypothetical protein [Pseudomonadota bacterium]MCP4917620.1 hypothetical protein [Pseudomonadota bacterium]